MILYQRVKPSPSLVKSEFRVEQQAMIDKWVQEWYRSHLTFDSWLETQPPGKRLRSLMRDPLLMAELGDFFFSKCAYCERKLHESRAARLSFFRPRQYTKQTASGASENDHYVWLSWQWFNLYLACEDCIKHKGDVFPILYKRVSCGVANIESLDAEGSLLIDPCRENPLAYLEFEPNGMVKVKTKLSRTKKERATATIAHLGLNDRDELRKARAAEAEDLRTRWNEAITKTRELQTSSINISALQIKVEELRQQTHPSQQFAGMKRWLLRRWFDEAIKHDADIRILLKDIPWQGLILPEWFRELTILPKNMSAPFQSSTIGLDNANSLKDISTGQASVPFQISQTAVLPPGQLHLK